MTFAPGFTQGWQSGQGQGPSASTSRICTGRLTRMRVASRLSVCCSASVVERVPAVRSLRAVNHPCVSRIDNTTTPITHAITSHGMNGVRRSPIAERVLLPAVGMVLGAADDEGDGAGEDASTTSDAVETVVTVEADVGGS